MDATEIKTNGHAPTMHQTILTPDLAKILSAPERLHPRQRVVQRKVNDYAATMRRGDWSLVYDPILIDRSTGLLFNGLQRCTAVIKSGVSIPVYIDWEADASIFAKIDSGVPRSAGQFVKATYNSIKVAATRIVMWQERDAGEVLSSRVTYPMWEIIDRTDELEEIYNKYVRQISTISQRLGIAKGVMLAACTLHDMRGNGAEVEEFLDGLVNPSVLTQTDPAWVVFDKFSRRVVQLRRRQVGDDWNIFVRALNAHVNDEQLPSRLSFSSPVSSLVGETESELNRRKTNAWGRVGRRKTRDGAPAAAAPDLTNVELNDDLDYVAI